MRRRRCTAAILALALAAVSVGAETQVLGESAGTVDLPAGWHALSGSNRFASRSGEAVLRVTPYPADAFSDPKAMAESIEAKLGANGEGVLFLYSGRPSFIADVHFESGHSDMRGYLITIIGADRSIALLGFAMDASYLGLHDELLSALDSYAIDSAAGLYPGPISQFYYPFPAPRREPMKLFVGGKEYSAPFDVREFDASQTVIDRETRVLVENKSVNVDAWRRYYRTIFRDNYHRLDPYLPTLEAALGMAGESPEQKAKKLLSWMQGFLYARTGTIADLSSPLLAFATQTGDCDSRTILYSILVRHLGIEAILMVSSTYSHSMVGVRVDGKGAHMMYDGKRYLVAELTAPVALGLIDSTMADPARWIAVDFPSSAVPATSQR